VGELATTLEPESRVRDARDLYLRENGFSLAMYREPSFEVPVGPWTLRLRNPPSRQRVVAAHDLHHVLTGFGTDWIGEIEVSAWECGAGLGGNPFAWRVCIPFALFGLLRCPRRTWRAWRQGCGARSLLLGDVSVDSLLELPLGEARRARGVGEMGAAEQPARLNARAPARTAMARGSGGPDLRPAQPRSPRS
jgi:hypothetical protein